MKLNNDAKEKWLLRLFIAGESYKSIAAYHNLIKICDEYLSDKHTIEVVDLLKHPPKQ